MDYRQYLNSGGSAIEFDEFQSRWLANLLQTDEPKARKYRAGRLVATLTRRLTASEEAELNKHHLHLPDFPFEVLERNDEPFLRVDRRDEFWTTYSPTAADLAYEPPHQNFHDIGWRLLPFSGGAT
jgi:hypothetical protein